MARRYLPFKYPCKRCGGPIEESRGENSIYCLRCAWESKRERDRVYKVRYRARQKAKRQGAMGV